MGEELFKQKIEEFEKVQYLEENPRLSWILDSTLWIPVSRYWVLDSLFKTCLISDSASKFPLT